MQIISSPIAEMSAALRISQAGGGSLTFLPNRGRLGVWTMGILPGERMLVLRVQHRK
ncbi:hypothetical protein TevJSym_ao00330 [endosymbiont of Tevnia jerichonana (vent Tica)]|uniref:Uncharacterized protein n=1 Tax=endosymbiont of Tevnia jerichonana (vent Tica) TaxID=1049564 RepID=G2FG14_9GAMM|nr:hypothetical protein TevJSym_ao00330 [endosymbiont of Tevnia jerichonana (vent Tica)]